MSGSSKKPPPPGSGSENESARDQVVTVGGSTDKPSADDVSATMSLPAIGALVPNQNEASWTKKMDPRIGQQFGKYQVNAVIGKGGMGMVYEGEDTILNRRVAIKFLPETLTQNPKAVERFITEAQVAGRLNHPNVIAIYDIGQESGHYYIVMELLNPLSAAGYVKERGPMQWSEAAKVIADCCAALHAAHQVGLIHRDIKPDNILCSPTGSTKLVDFGLVKDTQFNASALTQTGVVAGTPLYMSPEQASDGELDHRSDIYSLGATFFTLLTSKPPYTGDAAPQIMFKHVTAPTPNPRDLVPEIPESIAQVLMKAMSKSPADRYQTAEEMRLALETILTEAAQRKSFSFLVPHEPSMMNMRARPLRMSTLPGMVSASALNNPKASGQLNISIPPMSGRSMGPRPQDLYSSGQVSGQHSGGGPAFVDSAGGNQQGPQNSRASLLVGGLGLLAALFALALVSWRMLRPSDPSAGRQNKPVVEVTTPQTTKPPLRVGIIHSLSGTMAISSRPIVEATLMAIEEINAKGGVLGRRIEPVQADGRSDNATFAHEIERLITQEKVITTFGGWTPSNRREMKPIVEKYDNLLVFPSRDEGMEDSPNIIYNGATPNQQAIPAVKWAIDKLGSKRVFIIGSDGLLGRMCAELIRDVLQKGPAKIVGERYVLLSATDFRPVIKKILAAKPDVLLNFVNGDSNLPLFRELRAAGVSPGKLPTISFSVGENELQQLAGIDMLGDYLAWNYFDSIKRPENEQFVQRFRKKYGSHRGISDPMEAAYFGVYLWAQAVQAAGSDSVPAIRRALQGQQFEAPGSLVRIEPSNNHTWKMFRIGKITGPARIDVIFSSDSLLPPEPFPATRTRAEWEALLKFLYKQWDDSWVNPSRPNLLKTHHY